MLQAPNLLPSLMSPFESAFLLSQRPDTPKDFRDFTFTEEDLVSSSQDTDVDMLLEAISTASSFSSPSSSAHFDFAVPMITDKLHQQQTKRESPFDYFSQSQSWLSPASAAVSSPAINPWNYFSHLPLQSGQQQQANPVTQQSQRNFSSPSSQPTVVDESEADVVNAKFSFPTDLCHIRKSTRNRPSRSRGKSPKPSNHCHTCARTKESNKIHCRNFYSSKRCKKVVCEPCFNDRNLDFHRAKRRGDWLCPHCSGICSKVGKARCHIYSKVNQNRRKGLKTEQSALAKAALPVS